MNDLRRTVPMYQEMLNNFFNPQPRDDALFIETSTWSSEVKKEDVSISLEQHVLTLKGEHHFEQTQQQNGYTRRARAQGQFDRRHR